MSSNRLFARPAEASLGRATATKVLVSCRRCRAGRAAILERIFRGTRAELAWACVTCGAEWPVAGSPRQRSSGPTR